MKFSNSKGFKSDIIGIMTIEKEKYFISIKYSISK